MRRKEVLRPKTWCQLNIGGTPDFCARALEMANELPDPLRQNRMNKAPILAIERLVEEGFLKEVRPGVFRRTGKGQGEEQSNWDF